MMVNWGDPLFQPLYVHAALVYCNQFFSVLYMTIVVHHYYEFQSDLKNNYYQKYIDITCTSNFCSVSSMFRYFNVGIARFIISMKKYITTVIADCI